jgi:pilus assembly protein CpaC
MSAKLWPLRGVVAAALLSVSTIAAAQSPTNSGRANAAAASAQVEEIELPVGEQRVIPSDNVRSYSEGAKGIVDVRLTKDSTQFIVVALSPGQTTLLFLMFDGTERHYHITVSDPNGARRRGQDFGVVEARDNIRLDFYFVQVSKNYGHQIGLGWPSSISSKFAASYNLKAGTLDSATAVITDQALPRLDMGQTTGWAKIMRQAAVVTANGEKATFAGGGEVNVPIQSALTSGVQKIPFGSIIEVEPNYDAKSGRVELRLHADISELESDNGTGIPGRTTAALDTVVNLELGQSLVLGGLTARSARASKTGLPGLSQIPIFGVLFGSHGHSEDETENIVLIVPSVVDAVSMQARERVSDALKVYTEFSGDTDAVDFVPPTKTTPTAAPVAHVAAGQR